MQKWISFALLLIITPALNAATRLQERIDQLISSPELEPAIVGVEIRKLNNPTPLASINASKALTPASITKSFTCAVALDQMGPDYQIMTSFYVTEPISSDGTLRSPLIIYGRGDPTTKSSTLIKLAKQLKENGLKKIDGDIIADSSHMQAPYYIPNFEWDDLTFSYAPEIAALNLNENTATLQVYPGPSVGAPLAIKPSRFLPSRFKIENHTKTTGQNSRGALTLERDLGSNTIVVSGQLPVDHPPFADKITLHEPDRYFAETFKKILEDEGIQVTGTVKLTRKPYNPDGKRLELATIESLPLKDIVKTCLKESNNLYAQAIRWQTVSSHHAPYPKYQATYPERNADQRVQAFIKKQHLDSKDFHFVNGAGAGRQNLVTVKGMNDLLEKMHTHPEFSHFKGGLPIAGKDGTLKRRLKGTPMETRLFAKTGTHSDTHSLSGYYMPTTGGTYVFTIIFNHDKKAQSKRPITHQIDKILSIMAQEIGA